MSTVQQRVVSNKREVCLTYRDTSTTVGRDVSYLVGSGQLIILCCVLILFKYTLKEPEERVTS